MKHVKHVTLCPQDRQQNCPDSMSCLQPCEASFFGSEKCRDVSIVPNLCTVNVTRIESDTGCVDDQIEGGQVR